MPSRSLLLPLLVCVALAGCGDPPPPAAPGAAEAYRLGQAALDNGDLDDGLPLMVSAAQQGSTPARLRLGRMYMYGTGVPADHGEALHWFTLAASNAEAEFDIGLMYSTGGMNVLQDAKQAENWYRRAAAQGYIPAKYYLGELYRGGLLGGEDDANALIQYRQAAAANYAPAMTALGTMYLQGRGVTADPRQAMVWYRRAADGGNADAMTQIAAMYNQGDGIPRDDAQGTAWMRRAAAAGSEDAQRRLGPGS